MGKIGIKNYLGVEALHDTLKNDNALHDTPINLLNNKRRIRNRF